MNLSEDQNLCIFPHPEPIILKMGAKNQLEKVRQEQRKLKALSYYSGLIDGDFGPLTKAAVEEFQSDQFVTGEIDPQTSFSLGRKYDIFKEIKVLNIKKYPLSEGEYIAETTNKRNITLHLTAGGANAHWVHSTWALDSLQGKYPVATAYVISGEDHFKNFETQDGEIFEFFNPRYWAYHVNMVKHHNYDNLGIEICNLGPLRKLPDGRFIALASGAVVPEKQVEEITFRGFQYWHKITDGQLESLGDLLDVLLKMYPGIADSLRGQVFDSEWADYKEPLVAGKAYGIYPHTAWVKEETRRRFDMPPFPRLLEMLRSLQ